MATLTDIVNKVHNEGIYGLNKTQLNEIGQRFFTEIADQIKQSGRVAIKDFGVFSSSARAERVGRNPRTGEAVTIKASTNVKFKASQSIRSTVD